jgi:phosphoglycerol transferase
MFRIKNSVISLTLLPFAVLIITIFLLYRNYALYPIVFSDEYWYSIFSRKPLTSELWLPNYIFNLIYQVTNSCGESFLECARILNVIFFIATTYFIYQTARSVTNQFYSTIIVIFSLLSPVNIFTAIYSPESLYYFVFWIFTWFFLRIRNNSRSIEYIICGSIIAILSLIKPNALFFLPGLFFYILFLTKSFKKSCIRFTYLFITCLVFKAILGFALVGQQGLQIFGVHYGQVVSRSEMAYFSKIAALSLNNIAGNILILCVIFAIPLVEVLSNIFQRRIFVSTPPPLQ